MSQSNTLVYASSLITNNTATYVTVGVTAWQIP